MKEKIYNDIIDAMKNKDKDRLEVLRMVKGAIQLEEIKAKKELTDEDVLVVLGKQIKTRNESIEEFKKGGRQDLIDKTTVEVNILNEYMPELMSEEELVKLIKSKFDLTPAGIINYLKLKEPIYTKTTNYGHFGKDNLQWEKVIEL